MLGGAAQHLLGAELDRGAAHVLIRIADDDPARTRAVRLADDRTRRRRVLDLAEDDHLLPGLNVRADANRELGVAAEPLVGVREAVGGGRHRSEPSRCRMRRLTGSTGGSDRACR